MAYYKSLREYVEALDKAGKLVTINSPINKDSEMMSLLYLQDRGVSPSQAKSFLFTNVIDAKGKKYDIPVAAGILRGNFDIGLKCRPNEVQEKVAQALMHPIEPKLVNSGPVQEVVYMGDQLLTKGGMNELPAPNRHPAWDAGPIIGSSCWVTKDPETGARNVGVYRCSVYAPGRVGIHIGAVEADISTHWQKCRARGIPLQAAIVIGGPPNLTYVGPMKMDYDLDEYGVAGAMVGEPVELVKCKTVDLEVPANADIVIEGELSTTERMMEGPHGEWPGTISMGDMQPFLTIKCITHRKNPIWLVEAGGPNANLYKRLRYDLNMPFVLATGSPPSSAPGRLTITAIKVKTDTPQADVWRALEAAVDTRDWILAAVDEHIDIRDLDMVLWAICHKAEPGRDTRIVPFIDLHPLRCTYMPEPLAQGMRRAQFHPGALMPGDIGVSGGSTMLINATQKWPYPPLGLPTRDLMEHAMEIWEKEGLGPLELKGTWYGQELGYWPEEFAEDAARALKGEYYQTYEKRFAERVTNDDLPPGDYYQMRNRWRKYPQAGAER